MILNFENRILESCVNLIRLQALHLFIQYGDRNLALSTQLLAVGNKPVLVPVVGASILEPSLTISPFVLVLAVAGSYLNKNWHLNSVYILGIISNNVILTTTAA